MGRQALVEGCIKDGDMVRVREHLSEQLESLCCTGRLPGSRLSYLPQLCGDLIVHQDRLGEPLAAEGDAVDNKGQPVRRAERPVGFGQALQDHSQSPGEGRVDRVFGLLAEAHVGMGRFGRIEAIDAALTVVYLMLDIVEVVPEQALRALQDQRLRRSGHVLGGFWVLGRGHGRAHSPALVSDLLPEPL